MKAALMYGPNDIRVEDVPEPQCERGGMVIRVKACGLCGSDIRNLTTDSRSGDYPHIWGHEHAGEVVEVGPDNHRYKVGERLFVLAVAPCNVCENCRKGRSDLCLNPMDYHNRQGGFAEYLSVPAVQVQRGNIFRIPDDIPDEWPVIAEPLVSVCASQEKMKVGLGDVVAVLGAGPLGCLHAEMAKLRGAEKVMMTDISLMRLERVNEFGVDVAIDVSKRDGVEAVLQETDGLGASVVISANPTTAGQQQAIKMAGPGGRVCFFGGVPNGALTEIDSNVLHYNNLWILGHSGGNSQAVDQAVNLVFSGKIKAQKYITHRMPLENIVEAIELTRKGEAIKVVLAP